MNKKYRSVFLYFIYLGLILLTVFFLCSHDIAVLNPKGLIALKERNLLITATLLMLIVVIPTFILNFVFAWKYRESNTKAKYTPDSDYNFLVELIWWGFPCIIVAILIAITWISSHELDPFKPIESDKKPIKIQVVALQWKWLFIYPEEKIASVNFFQFPENTPVSFEITADAPMNSFWIPQLSGQVFAMPAMKTKLHIIANEIGSFSGSSANLSGKGFAGMTFIAKSSSEDDFHKWIESAKESPKQLTIPEYLQLAKPSEYDPVSYYVLKSENLFDRIVMKYMMPMPEMQSTD